MSENVEAPWSRPPAAVTSRRFARWSNRSAASCTRTPTACSAGSTTPRTRCRNRELKAWRALATVRGARELPRVDVPDRHQHLPRRAQGASRGCFRKISARLSRRRPTTAPRRDIPWLEPYPDALLPDGSDPEAALRLREGIRLAFVRAMQLLPPRQRAALILHDVLEWSVAEVAEMLETTESRDQQRAAARTRGIARSPDAGPAPADLDAKKAEVVDRFVRAWESGDFETVVSMLTDGCGDEHAAVGVLARRQGCGGHGPRSSGTWDGEPRPGRYRLLPSGMNGEPAALAYIRGADGRY